MSEKHGSEYFLEEQMFPEITKKIKRWQNIKPRKPEEMYSRWVLWLREWQRDYKPYKQCSYIDFMEWKAENYTIPKD